jgi:hypothetical protein
MPVRACVGRHANTGQNCQNWADDQQTVTALLNLIAADDGGAATGITGPVVAGMASAELFGVILTFQREQFPAQVTGFFDPSGQMLLRAGRLSDALHLDGDLVADKRTIRD